MNRRGFLGLLGGGAAGVALAPALRLADTLHRVYSFPARIVIAQPATVRFVRAWDPYSSQVICRYDVFYGFAPFRLDSGADYETITVPRESLVECALDKLQAKHPCPGGPVPTHLFARQGDHPQMGGVQWVEGKVIS